MQKVLWRVLGPEKYGALGYRVTPRLGRAWGGAFNGQRWRCLMVSQIITHHLPRAIVETGTFRGTTTEWLSAFQLPIYACEYSENNYGFTKARLEPVENVHLTLSDSRIFLKGLVEKALHAERSENLLFYLDAHWGSSLPLAEELETIFRNCTKAVVVIDDFEVLGDPGYGFDDYGEVGVLNKAYIEKVIEQLDLSLFYPSTPSAEETGAKRGCVVLCSPSCRETLRQVSLLTQFQ